MINVYVEGYHWKYAFRSGEVFDYYGEDFTETYSLRDGRWFNKKNQQVSRAEIIQLLDPNDIDCLLEEEEREDLLNDDTEKLVMEAFQLLGFDSLEKITDWCSACYKLDQNPLPAIRKVLEKTNVQVKFFHDCLGLLIECGEKPALWVLLDDCKRVNFAIRNARPEIKQQ